MSLHHNVVAATLVTGASQLYFESPQAKMILLEFQEVVKM